MTTEPPGTTTGTARATTGIARHRTNDNGHRRRAHARRGHAHGHRRRAYRGCFLAHRSRLGREPAREEGEGRGGGRAGALGPEGDGVGGHAENAAMGAGAT